MTSMSSTGYAIYIRLAVMSRGHPGLSIHAIFMGVRFAVHTWGGCNSGGRAGSVTAVKRGGGGRLDIIAGRRKLRGRCMSF